MQWMFPVIIVFAIYLFLRGHDLPGGGFVAGITMAIAFILQYLAGGTRWVEDRLRILPVAGSALGLLMALLTGVGVLVVRLSVPHLALRSMWNCRWSARCRWRPPCSSTSASSRLVVGATVLILIAIAHQSIRAGRASARRRDRDGGAT